MEKLIKEILEGKKAYDIEQKKSYTERAGRGKGTKQYIIKRIDLVREQLLELKKELK